LTNWRAFDILLAGLKKKEKEVATKQKIHTVYKTRDGERVPSVTTILNILAKPALIHWAWDMGTQGLDYRKVRDSAADIGTLAHYLIMCYLKNETPDTSEYSPDVLNQAENSLIKFWDWEKENPIQPFVVEEPLVSEKHGYGGTIDCLAKLHDRFTLIDFKTGKAIYNEATIQVIAYSCLLTENGYPVDSIKILRIGRDDREGFEEKTIYDDKEIGWRIFLRCLDIYELQKQMQ
jgi:hypothetical protein